MNKLFRKTLITAAALALVSNIGYAAQGSSSQSNTPEQSTSAGSSDTSKSAGSSGSSGSSGSKAQGGKSGQAATGKSQTSAQPPFLILVPVDVATQGSSMQNGCWAKIYDSENFSGDTLTLSGPISLADMSGPFGLDWDDRVNSIEVGPKATVTVYDNESYRDQVARFKSGQRVADLSKRMGFFDEFASIKVDCQTG